MDVAKAEKDLFIPRKEGNRLYGRGAFWYEIRRGLLSRLLKELKNNFVKIWFRRNDHVRRRTRRREWCEVFYWMKGYGWSSNTSGREWRLENWKKLQRRVVFCRKKLREICASIHSMERRECSWGVDRLLCKLQKRFRKEPCGDPLHVHSTIDINELNTGERGIICQIMLKPWWNIFFIDEGKYEKITGWEKDIRKSILA